jgi:predicted heme/steroid binding protein
MQTPLLLAAALTLALLTAQPTPAPATEEFAACSGRACGHCHRSAAGGGELTDRGAAFRQAIAPPAEAAAPATLRRALRGTTLFVHIVTAFFWFGTILYVHLILKPAYAAQGLPRGELRLGWGGIASIAITGTILTLQRVDSWHALFHTRFGVLLSIKIALFLVMASTAVLVTFVIGPRLGKTRSRSAHPGKGEFTPEDLAPFDGREGRQALVGYAGKVYDLSASRMWSGGTHVRRHAAGADQSQAIALAPHGEEKLAAFPVVGTLRPAGAGHRPPSERRFYFMAYLNLGLVIAVLAIITLWHL